jgi:hypothetical protein
MMMMIMMMMILILTARRYARVMSCMSYECEKLIIILVAR